MCRNDLLVIQPSSWQVATWCVNQRKPCLIVELAQWSRGSVWAPGTWVRILQYFVRKFVHSWWSFVDRWEWLPVLKCVFRYFLVKFGRCCFSVVIHTHLMIKRLCLRLPHGAGPSLLSFVFTISHYSVATVTAVVGDGIAGKPWDGKIGPEWGRSLFNKDNLFRQLIYKRVSSNRPLISL